MPQVQVFTDDDKLNPLFVAEFDFMPRVGEYVSKDVGGYFSYYNVVEVWHAQQLDIGGTFHACIRVELDD